MTVTPERAGYLVEFGPTDQIFMHPQKQVTKDYVTGRVGWYAGRRKSCGGATEE